MVLTWDIWKSITSMPHIAKRSSLYMLLTKSIVHFVLQHCFSICFPRLWRLQCWYSPWVASMSHAVHFGWTCMTTSILSPYSASKLPRHQKDLKSLSFNPQIALTGRLHYYRSVDRSEHNNNLRNIAVSIHDTDNNRPSKQVPKLLPALDTILLPEQTDKSHDEVHYVQTFWHCKKGHFLTIDTPPQNGNTSDRRPSAESIWRCNGTEALEIAAVIPGDKQNLNACRDFVMKCHCTLNPKTYKNLRTINVSHMCYDIEGLVLVLLGRKYGW